MLVYRCLYIIIDLVCIGSIICYIDQSAAALIRRARNMRICNLYLCNMYTYIHIIIYMHVLILCRRSAAADQTRLLATTDLRLCSTQVVGTYTSCRYTTRLYRQLTSLSPVLALVNRLNTTYVAHVYILGVYV